MKELEKLGPKEKGVISQSVKEVGLGLDVFETNLQN